MLKKIFILSLFLSMGHNSHGEEAILKESLDSPRKTFKVFLKNMVLVKQKSRLQDEAYREAISTLNLEHIDPSSRTLIGKTVARQLMTVFDKTEKIDYTNIPQSPKKDTWYYLKRNIKDTDQLLEVEIAVTKTKEGQWLFSQETVNSIGEYYHYLSSQEKIVDANIFLSPREKLRSILPAWANKKVFLLYNDQWIGLLALLIFSLLLEKIIRFVLANYVSHKFSKLLKIELSKTRQKSFTLPFGIFTVSIIWLLGIQLLGLSPKILIILNELAQVVAIASATWMGHHLIDMFSFYFENIAKKTENKFDDILVPLLNKTAKVVLYSFATIAMAYGLGFNVTNLIAGLGIGGLAFAFAAKDTLANFFGSIMIVLDRPFQMGDWISLEGDIHGTIEEVGFRSTRIRTFYNSVISIPNGQLTNMRIDNYEQRQYRRFLSYLNLQYDTPPEKIEAFCQAIREIVKKSPEIRQESYHVYLNQFSSSSIDVMIYIFFEVPSYQAELQARHQFLSNILRLAKNMDIRFAFPTQTLHLYNEQNEAYQNIHKNSQENKKYAQQDAEKILKSPIILKDA